MAEVTAEHSAEQSIELLAEQPVGQHVEVDETLDDDKDSAIGSEWASDTTSLQSWITDYREENGRTYHAFRDGAYFQPNDELAQETLDISHHLFLKTFDNKLFLAPLPEQLNKVLDIGTGTGIWAIDFADEHPEAEVIGTDLSPIQPQWTPPNCKFEIDDADQSNWTFDTSTIDFIHIRSLFGCISSWPTFYSECYRTLKPGGWIEQAEFSPGFYSEDGTVTPQHIMGDWIVNGKKVFEIMGKEIMVFEKMKGLIEEAGFVDVEERKYKWPIGTWPKNPRLKELGAWTRAHLDNGLEGWTLRGLTALLGWTREEVLAYCAGMRADMRNPKLHGIHEMRVVFARKPIHA